MEAPFLRRRCWVVNPPPIPTIPAMPRASTNADRLWLGAALLLPLIWFVAYARAPLLCDEIGHIGNVDHILAGKPGWPEGMTMLPGYHYVVAGLAQLGWLGAPLVLARGVSVIASLCGLWAFALAWRKLRGTPAGKPTFLVGILPLLQPFTAMAYTDAAALALVLLAIAAHTDTRPVAAAVLFVAAALVRQTNLLWAAFLIAWAFAESWRDGAAKDHRPFDIRRFIQRTGLLLGVLAVATMIVLKTGRITVGTNTGTAAEFNIATVHGAGHLLLVLGLPLWLAGLPLAARRLGSALRQQPLRTTALTLLVLAVAGGLHVNFRNGHIWNRELWWPDATFTLLRNWPLVWAERHEWVRFLSSLNVAFLGLALATWFAKQPRRLELCLCLGFGALLPLTNNLVEPRYWLPALAVGMLFVELTVFQTRVLLAWWGLVALVHAPFIIAGRSLW